MRREEEVLPEDRFAVPPEPPVRLDVERFAAVPLDAFGDAVFAAPCFLPPTLERTRPVAATTVSLARLATPGARSAIWRATLGACELTASAAFLTADGARAVARRTTSGALSAIRLATAGVRSATRRATSGACSVTFFATPGALAAAFPIACAA